MRKLSFLAASFFLVATAAFAQNQAKEEQRLNDAGTVLKEVLDVPEGIPQDLLNRAVCVAVYPSVIKAAFGLGGEYGRGALVCRTGADYKGPWGAPAMYALEGGSFGFQLGVQSTDFVILVMNQKGAESLLNSKVKLGADASVAAGPKGRDAEAATDVYMRAEMLTYSRARGVFAGVSLEGSTMRPDDDANEHVYGRRISARDIVQGKVNPPAAGQALVSVLQSASPHDLSNPPANSTQTQTTQTSPTSPAPAANTANPSTSQTATPASSSTPTSTPTAVPNPITSPTAATPVAPASTGTPADPTAPTATRPAPPPTPSAQ